MKPKAPDKKIQAKDLDCVDCGKQAEVFFPVFDPDIRSYPYCRPCVDKRRMELIIKFTEEGLL